jgi:hypothetical protein
VARWRLKAGLQGAIALSPRSTHLNRLFQRYVTRSLEPTLDSVGTKWDQTHDLVEAWRGSTGHTGGFAALEVGTGWLPVAPLALLGSGATSVVTIDVQPLLRTPELMRTLQVVLDGLEAGALKSVRPELPGLIIDALTADPDQSPVEVLAPLSITPVVGDARSTRLEAGSIDLSVSNNTLEHIPVDDLALILAELRRLCADGGGSSHFIDLKDHYAGFDGSIGVYNFLRFSEHRWRWYNNRLHYQNRLRASDYLKLAKRSGFDVADVRTDAEPEALPASIATEFSCYDREDLLVHSLWLTLLPAE